MHLLFYGVSTVISFIMGRLLGRLSVQFALIIAYIAVVLLMFVAFYSALNVLISSASVVFPVEFSFIISALFPTNFAFCFSLVLSARILKASLVWAIRAKTLFVTAAMNT